MIRIEKFTDSIRSELLHDEIAVELTCVHLPAVNTPQFSWCENHMPYEPEPVPYFARQDRVGGPAVDQEAHGRGRSAFATHVDVDVHHSHAVLLRSAAPEGNS